MKYKISKEDFYKLMMLRQKEKAAKRDDIYYGYLSDQKLKRKPRRFKNK